jgi:hypothetical protein
MDQKTWISYLWPEPMLEFLHGITVHGERHNRKLRLFACACCRRVWDALEHPAAQNAVRAAERYADDPTEANGAHLERRYARLRYHHMRVGEDYREPAMGAARCAANVALPLSSVHMCALDARRAAAFLSGIRTFDQAKDTEAAAQAALVRATFGDPFTPKTYLSCARCKELHMTSCRDSPLASWLAWQGGVVKRLALEAYGRRIAGGIDPERLLVLADALEEAGCEEESILCHLRKEEDRYRGDWVLDMLLEKF